MSNKPELVERNGDKYWYQNDLRHRTDGPAIEYANGDKCWYQNDLRHRTDGPAIEYANGDKYWYEVLAQFDPRGYVLQRYHNGDQNWLVMAGCHTPKLGKQYVEHIHKFIEEGKFTVG